MTSVELFSAIGLALDTVREHKLRSFLTVLGVIIGTGTIIDHHRRIGWRRHQHPPQLRH